MKKLSIFIILFFAIGGCTDDFEELNIDPNRLSTITPGTVLNPVIYGMASFNTSRSNSFNFHLMQVALPYPSPAGGIHRYDISENNGSGTWNTSYRWLNNLKEMRRSAVEAENPNYEAIAMVLNAWIYANLTDTFGDIPMEEANGADDGIFQPQFNTQQEVYTAILEDLRVANTLFDTDIDMIFGSDLLYGNDITRWRKFCNSLRLRLLLRVSQRQEMNAIPQLQEMLSTPDVYPVFESNGDAAILQITGVAPNLSPWGRAIDFSTFRAGSAFFIDHLVAWDDPRLPLFFTQAMDSDGQTAIGYKGIPSGYAGSEGQFDFQPSGLNNSIVTAPMISVIMTYAEVAFIKAELAQKGHIAGDSEVYYNAGISAALEQWGVEVPEGYLEQAGVAYDGSFEAIMLQKYYALYFNDNQQWFEYRRTGLPELPKTEAMLNNQQIPVRLQYPLSVRTNNSQNYQQTIERMGGDNINTKVWWQQN